MWESEKVGFGTLALECDDSSSLFALGDLSPKQRRVQAAREGVRARWAFDGDKSPTESGENSPHSKDFAKW